MKSSRPIEAKVLAALRNAGPGGVSAEHLAHCAVCSPSAVITRIQAYREAGYEIVSDPHHGFSLVAEPDRLVAGDLLSRILENAVIGSDLRVVGEISSTNDAVEQLARDGAPEGLVVFAEAQTGGRGRLGRSWFSPAGKGLWFSILLRPFLQPQGITRVTIAAATALVRALQQETGVALEIKWPNDIIAGGGKVAGILTELRGELDKVNDVVVGIGANVNIGSEEFPEPLRAVATSLMIEAKGRRFPRPVLAGAILREMDRDYDRLTRGDFSALAAEWERQCGTLGRDVTIRIGGRTVSGRAEALDENGALLLRTEHGHLEHVVGGDVTVE